MKLFLPLLFAISLLADQPVGVITKGIGLDITHCHPGDLAIIHLTPIDEVHKLSAGTLLTRNEILTFDDLAMLPDGTNVAEIRTVCRGQTSEVQRLTFVLKRPPPPPKAKLVRMAPQRPTPMPPSPPGMAEPLPDEQNRKWVEQQERIKRAMERQTAHRSE